MLTANIHIRSVKEKLSGGILPPIIRIQKSAMYPTPTILPMVPMPIRERSQRITGMNINRLNSSWQVPKVTPVRADTPRVKVEQGSVPKPTVLNTAMQTPIAVRLIASASSRRPMRGRRKWAARLFAFIWMRPLLFHAQVFRPHRTANDIIASGRRSVNKNVRLSERP